MRDKKRDDQDQTRRVDNGLFPGESMDLPEENPRQYQNFNNNYGYGRGVRNFNNGYGQWEEEQPAQEDFWSEDDWEENEEDWDEGRGEEDETPEEGWQPYREEPKGPAIHAYNADFREDPYERRLPKRPAPRPARQPQHAPQPQQPKRPRQPQEDQELEQYGQMRQQADARRKTRKKRKTLRRIVALLLILVLLPVLLINLAAKMPKTDQPLGQRRKNCAAILVVGLDQGETRTDTMMLLFLDGDNHQVNLLSLPRDTYVSGGYYVPKLNSVYGGNGCGDEGREALLEAVADCIGYRPDGYVLVDLDTFVKIVDIMGGVEFEVPCDMKYSDKRQGWHVDLREGLQMLDGQQAMGLVRYRMGYARADLRRVEVQRDFVKAAMEQWLSVGKISSYPAAVKTLISGTDTDLSFRNLLWIAKVIAGADLGALETKTLPGEATYIGDGSYYLLWENATAEMVNEYFNPYVREITVEDLHIAG